MKIVIYFQYGYRTLRGHKALSDSEEIEIERGNPLTFYNTDFNIFLLDYIRE